MEKLENDDQNIRELNPLEMINTFGGNPVLIFIAGAILGGIIYDLTKWAYNGSKEALIERASNDDYIMWADMGHR